jgi:hypothetical protein
VVKTFDGVLAGSQNCHKKYRLISLELYGSQDAAKFHRNMQGAYIQVPDFSAGHWCVREGSISKFTTSGCNVRGGPMIVYDCLALSISQCSLPLYTITGVPLKLLNSAFGTSASNPWNTSLELQKSVLAFRSQADTLFPCLLEREEPEEEFLLDLRFPPRDLPRSPFRIEISREVRF